MPAAFRPSIAGRSASERASARPAGLARDLAGLHRHQRALVRPRLEHERQEVGPRIPFDVELHPVATRREVRGDLAHVVGTDVALVGARDAP